MFKIASENFHGTEKIKLINALTGEYLSVLPAYGGNLNELVLSNKKSLQEIIAGDHSIDSFLGKAPNAYRGAKLSPFPNRINQGHYTFQSIDYSLTPNDLPHALHGLLWNKPFTVKEQRVTQDYARLVLSTPYNHTEAGYPFSYELEIEYVLDKYQTMFKTTVTNGSTHAIPLGDGWHPYVTLGIPIDQLHLELPSSKKIECDHTLIPTGHYLNDKAFERLALIGHTRFDDCYELPPVERIAETRLQYIEKNITLVLWQQTGIQGYNFLQVYTPPDRQSIAIEPTSCAPDAFNNHNGLIVLDPLEMAAFVFGIRLE